MFPYKENSHTQGSCCRSELALRNRSATDNTHAATSKMCLSILRASDSHRVFGTT